jgi:mannose-6-phosphate isomerase-like protein (cupin superfamily)
MNYTIDPHFFVKKGWGYEQWICNNEKYCGKILIFNPNKKCSIHYHVIKDEVLYVDNGTIELIYFFKDQEERETIILHKGMSFHVPVGLVHQMIAGNEGAKIIEFSTHHEDSDSIRIEKGD